MTVKQLIKKLQKEDPKAVIAMLSDAEGNSIHGLASVDFEMDSDGGNFVCLTPNDEWVV